MALDPVCGMKAKTSSPFHFSKDGTEYYFCSQHCLEKFAQQEGIVLDPVPGAQRPTPAFFPFLKNKAFLVFAVLLGLCLLSYAVPFLVPFRHTLLMYFSMIWWALLLGLVLGGVIDYYVPREIFAHLLARTDKSTIFYAVGLGFLMSVCNHGILAIAMQLHKKGASTSAVVAFLLASPWANFPLTLMLVGFFGVTKALYIVLSAIVVALITGFIYQFFESKAWVAANRNTVYIRSDYSLARDVQVRFQTYNLSREQLIKDFWGVWRGGLALNDMILWWILLGAGLASFFGAYIPQNIFHEYMGPSLKGMIVTLGVATVIEVCSEGTAPLAFEIYRQTNALGNSLVFLMAGVVTDYTEIGLLWQNVGRRAAVLLPVVTVPQVLVLGFIANRIFQ